jgi:hypothetical protein
MRKIFWQKRIWNPSFRELCADVKLTRIAAKFLDPLRGLTVPNRGGVLPAASLLSL